MVLRPANAKPGVICCVVLACAAAAAAPPTHVVDCRLRFAETLSLASERFGVVAEVAEPGRVIAAGGVVALLRDDALRIRREVAAEEARNDIEARYSRKAAELARLTHDRAAQANGAQPGAVSELELRGLLLAAEKAELQSEQADHALRLAELRLGEADAELAALRVAAPADVFVRAIRKRPGEVVQAGEVVAEVVRTDEVLVDAHVPVAVAAGLRTGQSVAVEVDLAASTARLMATVRFIDVKVEPVSQRLRVVAWLPNDGGLLREGLAARVAFPPASAPRAAGVAAATRGGALGGR